MDLNLLLGLDALLEHRSVQDAAAQLRLTPPAVSRILGRLRAATGDEILVRNGREMVPTPRALALRDEVAEVLARARAVLEPQPALDLAALRRTFVVRCHDSLLTTVSPPLTAATAAAPGVVLRIVGELAGDDRDLSRGGVDLEIGGPAPASVSIVTEAIGADEMMLVLRNGHPLTAAPVRAEQLAAARHIVVSRRGRVRGPVDERLAEAGLERVVAATVPTVAAALAVVASSDAVTVLPSRLRDPLSAEVTAVALPFPLPASVAALSWHRRHEGDPAHRWLRETVAGILRSALLA